MERENRYFVLKRKDMEAVLAPAELRALEAINNKVDLHRIEQGKAPLTCVVVEHDWPEYGPTWDAIERRVDAGN